MSRSKTKEAPQTVLLHVRMNEFRLRITPITLWFRTMLESAARPKCAGIGRGAPAVVRRRGQRAWRQPVGSQCLYAA